MSPLPPAGPAGAGPAPPAPAPAGSAAERPALQQAAEHLAAGRPAHAADALGRIAAETPTYAAAHVLHAVALEAAGRPADALAAWHRAAFLVPRSPLVLRERQRLVALLPAETPAGPPAPAVWTETPAPEPTETAALETAVPETAAPETATSETAASPDGAAPDEPADDVDAVPETIPLDDLAPSFTLDPGDDGDFDPDGFDLSAFDLGDEALGDDDDWLDLSTPGAPPSGEIPSREIPSGEIPPEESLYGENSSGGSSSGRPAFGEEPAASAWLDDDPAPPLTDWADRLGDDALRLMPPEPAAAPEPAAPRADAPSAWAVFEDEPTTTPAPPPAAETLPTPDAAPPDAAPAGAAAAPPPSVGDELDSLIASLEHVPRIRPDPAFRGPAVGTAGTEADVAEMASETLARIYAAQHQYVRAALVYETLAAREPGRADALLEQAAAMRQRRAG